MNDQRQNSSFFHVRIRTALASLAIWLVSVVFASAQDSNFWRNLRLGREMERTNPAMIKTMEVAFAAQERHLASNLWSRIERVREFGMLFTNCVQQFAYSVAEGKPHLWTVQMGLYDRYILRMRVPFNVDSTWTNVVSYEGPKFVILEWLGPGGMQHYISCERLQTEWQRFLLSGGDFSTVGLVLTTNSPMADFDVYWKTYFRNQ